MQVKTAMKRRVVSAPPTMTVRAGAQLMVQNRVDTLPIVDADGRLIGMVTIRSILNTLMPDYFALLKDMHFVHDFGAMEEMLLQAKPQIADRRLQSLMEPPESVQEEESLWRAATRMVRHNLNNLPVVNAEGRLVGILSQADLSTTFLRLWLEGEETAQS